MSDQAEPSFSPPTFVPAPPAAPPHEVSVLISVEPPPKPKRGKWVALFAVAALLIGGFVAYLVTNGDDGERYSLRAATAGAARATSVAYEMTMTTGASGTITATGRFDIAARLMALDMEIPALDGVTVSAVFDLDNTMMYMEVTPELEAQGMTAPTKWVGFDLSALPGFSDIFKSAGQNPLDVAKAFSVAKSVDDIGRDTVKGEKVEHYRVTVETAKVLEQYPALQEMIDASAGGFPDEYSYDVYVNEQNQLRRVTYSIDAAGQPFTADIVYTAVDHIDPVVVPDPSDVTDVNDLG